MAYRREAEAEGALIERPRPGGGNRAVKTSAWMGWFILLLTVSGCTSEPHGDGDRPGSVATAVSTRPSPPDVAGPPADSTADADDAVTELEIYFRSLNAGDFAAAYLVWGDSGRTSGQTLDEFREGYRLTARIDASVGPPGRIEGAAGSRYVELPVVLEATTDAGEAQHFRGSYVMRRVVVDGAAPSQRKWHIYSAEMREAE